MPDTLEYRATSDSNESAGGTAVHLIVPYIPKGYTKAKVLYKVAPNVNEPVEFSGSVHRVFVKINDVYKHDDTDSSNKTYDVKEGDKLYTYIWTTDVKQVMAICILSKN